MSRLRSGFTTGTCAAAASKAAAMILLGRPAVSEVEISPPKGERFRVPVLYARKKDDRGEAAVRKDSGNDPDVTAGITVIAEASFTPGKEIVIAAGEGVGTVTKPGLSVPSGEPAVNPVPRQMIREALHEVTDRGIKIVLSIPEGKELAARTFNPRLGIVGGLSILGTTGWVRPFSSSALRTSLKCTLDVAIACGVEAPIFVPGHIGERAARRLFHPAPEQVIEVSNEWGYMLDLAAAHDWAGLLVLGHPGKLAKLAMGEWDTHSAKSKSAVSFVTVLAAELTGQIRDDCPTVEGIFSSLFPEDREVLGGTLSRRVSEAVSRRTGERFSIAALLVNMQGTRLGSYGDLTPWKEENP